MRQKPHLSFAVVLKESEVPQLEAILRALLSQPGWWEEQQQRLKTVRRFFTSFRHPVAYDHMHMLLMQIWMKVETALSSTLETPLRRHVLWAKDRANEEIPRARE